MREAVSATPCALIVMGVSGSGKSTVADVLAKRIEWTYEDGDKFHPASNVAKMKAGHPPHRRGSLAVAAGDRSRD